MMVVVGRFLIQFAHLRPFKIGKRTIKYDWSDSGSASSSIRSSSSSSAPPPSSFGLLFDIDGVIVRGRKVLPSAVEAFQKLTDSEGRFRVPTIFVTNAGNTMRHQKALQLSNWLGVHVREEQVVMSHSPLRLFRQFHDKHCLISGQGPIVEIAKGLGFTKVTTVDQLRNCFPTLDAVDQKRRSNVPCAFERYFPRFEAVVLFGEPVRWETYLQLILDVLMTNGLPCEALPNVPYPHLPLLACNMDLQWMAEACLPRFGHGAFLVCLENLYKKVTGKDMIYTALVGKPSEITYHHAEYCVLQEAAKISLTGYSSVQRLYAIGDNVNTDIYGANLYNRYVQRRNKMSQQVKHQAEHHHQVNAASQLANLATSSTTIHHHKGDVSSTTRGAAIARFGETDLDPQVTSCESILVCTGVYNDNSSSASASSGRGGKGSSLDDLDHAPRDFLPAEVGLKEPLHVVENVLGAVDLIFTKEGFS